MRTAGRDRTHATSQVLVSVKAGSCCREDKWPVQHPFPAALPSGVDYPRAEPGTTPLTRRRTLYPHWATSRFRFPLCQPLLLSELVGVLHESYMKPARKRSQSSGLKPDRLSVRQCQWFQSHCDPHSWKPPRPPSCEGLCPFDKILDAPLQTGCARRNSFSHSFKSWKHVATRAVGGKAWCAFA